MWGLPTQSLWFSLYSLVYFSYEIKYNYQGMLFFIREGKRNDKKVSEPCKKNIWCNV